MLPLRPLAPLLLAGVLAAASDAAVSAPERIALADGRAFVGSYDETKGKLTVRGAIPFALYVQADQIVERRPATEDELSALAKAADKPAPPPVDPAVAAAKRAAWDEKQKEGAAKRAEDEKVAAARYAEQQKQAAAETARRRAEAEARARAAAAAQPQAGAKPY